MKGIKKALAAILSLAVMVSIAPQAVFAGNSDRYEKVPGMQTIVADAEIHVYATKGGGTVTLTGKSSASTFLQGSGFRQYQANLKEDWVWKGWTYKQLFKGRDLGNRTDNFFGKRYSFSQHSLDWRTPYNGTAQTISVNRLTTTGETVWNKITYEIYANFNPTITAGAGEGGAITDVGKKEVEYGGNKSYTVTAAKGKMIDSLTVDGQTVSDAAGKEDFTYMFRNVTAPHKIQVTFKNKVYTVSYEFVSKTNKDLPNEVNELLPEAESKEHGMKVTPPTLSKDSVKAVDGIWTFEGWKPAGIDSLTDNQTFTGTWRFSPYAVVINTPPTINAEDKMVMVGDTFDPKKDVTANDAEDGDLTDKIDVIENTVDTAKAGTYAVTYKVTDKDGASRTKTITVTVKEKEEQPAAPTTPGDNNNQGKAGKTGKTAKTGDEFPIGLIAGAALLALAGAGAVGFARRRKTN